METKRLITAGVVACVGVVLLLIGIDVIPQRVVKPNVPGWVLVVIGLVPILAGGSVFLHVGSPVASRMVGVSLLLMALVFLWAALLTDPRHMSGGIPFFPDRCNWLLGRFAFGIVALFFAWAGVWALKHQFSRSGG